jgi:hypothetical protein
MQDKGTNRFVLHSSFYVGSRRGGGGMAQACQISLLKGQSHEIFDPRLRAMPHSAEWTHIREYLREIETKLKNIFGH